MALPLHNMLDLFLKHIQAKLLFTNNDKLLLAVSGGIDSVVLCDLCAKAGFSFSIAHCNFQLRGEESNRDEKFVKQLANKYQVPYFIQKFETAIFAKENKLSIQEAARELRYNWFNGLIEARNLQIKTRSLLLTAHHADDNIETLLMHFFRGTGLAGLTGIPEIANYIRRPLLPFTKEELRKYVTANQLSFVEDSSNQSIKYTRNYFRNELLPAIANVYPQVQENLRNNIERFSEIEALYQIATQQIISKLCKRKGKEVQVPIKQLAAYNNRALIYELISPYGFTEKQVEEVVKLFSSESGKYVNAPSGTHRIIRHRHWLMISPIAGAENQHFIIDSVDTSIQFSLGTLTVRETQHVNPDTSSKLACIDTRLMGYPLILRKYKAGDYFYPLGMRKKKKLSRFFIDQKLSKTEKENMWVVESNKKIIWVVGYRIDDRVKITNTTQAVTVIQLHT
ncbi:MAG: tRNA lysidine(34) synthetase TilS [Bacteroidota bacterium]